MEKGYSLWIEFSFQVAFISDTKQTLIDWGKLYQHQQ